jgi:spermidine/putrescine transport system substrate-binding protein
MPRENGVERLLGGRIGRRDFARALAAAGLAAASWRPGRAHAAPSLMVYEWAGYELPELHPAYVAKYGASPEFAFFGTVNEALQKMLSGFRPDIAHPCSTSLKRWQKAEVLQPIDVSRLSHYADLWPKLRDVPHAQENGSTWFVPFDCGSTSVLYRTDLVDPEDVKDPSWALLFNEKYKGKLAMYNGDTTPVEIAARVLGSDSDFTHLSDEQLADIRDLLGKQRELLRFYWEDNTQVEQALASGEVVAAMCWNGSVKPLQEQGLPVKYMTPKEGVQTWVCGLVRCTDAPGDEDAAYDLIDAMIAPEAGAYLIEKQGYAHANAKAYDLVPQEALAKLGVDNPQSSFSAASVTEEPDEPYRSRYIELMDQIRAGFQ